jgi:hypothetical protein
MLLSSSLHFVGRVRRRLVRELRLRAGGVERKVDRLAYQAFKRETGVGGRMSAWLKAASWAGGTMPTVNLSDHAGVEEIAAVVAAAERAMAHQVDLLGSGVVNLGADIDWHRDFKSGHRWNPRLDYGRSRWDNLPPGVDVKVPWELSRCMHFAALGLADWATSDQRYYLEWKAQIRHWILSNPVGVGVNWACAMDVGMRAVNWLVSAQLFSERIVNDGDAEFLRMFDESLWHHGLQVERNLEWSGPRGRLAGNHFIANLVGLLGIGAYFKGTAKSGHWWRFAKRWCDNEMTRQVNPDGSNYETSTSYHRMVMEMLLWADTVATVADDPFSAAYRERLCRMAAFVAAYSAPGGKAAQFGDNDSGRLLWAGVDDGSDHRYLTRGTCGFGGGLNRLLLRGGLALPGNPMPEPSAFTDGGFHFIHRGATWVGLRAGPVSHGGAHAHCDQLSFVLNLGGRDIFVDRGTGVYTPDPAQRNRYRATASHNVCQVNDWEQNGFSHQRNSVFLMPDHAHARVIRFSDDGSGVEWEAEHRGFERFRVGMKCQRRVRVTADAVEIHDQIGQLQAGDQVTWRFHLAPGLHAECDVVGMTVKTPGLVVRLEWDFPAAATIERTCHSPSYGVETPAAVLVLQSIVTADTGSRNFRIWWTEQR